MLNYIKDALKFNWSSSLVLLKQEDVALRCCLAYSLQIPQTIESKNHANSFFFPSINVKKPEKCHDTVPLNQCTKILHIHRSEIYIYCNTYCVHPTYFSICNVMCYLLDIL
jgi:hypothetical protein